MRRKFLFLAAVVFFAGCAGKQILKPSDEANLLYLENNETLHEMKFDKLQNSLDDFNKFANIIGKAEIKAAGVNAEFSALGDLMQGSAADKMVLVKNLSTNHELILSNASDIEELVNAKNIKFYEISNGAIKSIVYSTKSMPVCEAFAGGKEVIKVKSVTNHPLKNGFFAVILNSDISNDQGFFLRETSYYFNLSSEDEEKIKAETLTQNFYKTFIESDLVNQGKILSNVLCFSKFQKAF
ncbi:hypothetical protein [Campylobacter concisus]|uniref:DUF8095 domain-containing protein n=1 Tax=Campylobacter concisus TaxID=199 RepID=A0A1Y5MGB1_9BACT|nr:hypothetical protein [Campylobacter concisus]OUT07636.1 hypothetical protein B9N65_05355 [Campylobacter concisus]